MKKQLTSMDIRVQKVARPSQDYIAAQKEKANKVMHTALCKCVLPDIYTR